MKRLSLLWKAGKIGYDFIYKPYLANLLADIFHRFRRYQSIYDLAMRCRARIETGYAFSGIYIPLVFIYQVGKVGSSTIHRSLLDANFPNPILYPHYLTQDLAQYKAMFSEAGMIHLPYHLYLSHYVCGALKKQPDIPCKVISMVRDPVALVISNLFENPEFSQEYLSTDNRIIDSEKAVNYLQRYLAYSYAFDHINDWFDRELKIVFGLDVFAEYFPVDQGYAIYEKGGSQFLIMRLEDLSQKGSQIIARFLDLKSPLELKRANVRSESSLADVYQEVLSKVCLSPVLCEKIYSSRFSQHFYGADMIAKFIARWTGNFDPP
jgi:hypothetical protein